LCLQFTHSTYSQLDSTKRNRDNENDDVAATDDDDDDVATANDHNAADYLQLHATIFNQVNEVHPVVFWPPCNQRAIIFLIMTSI